ncbi:MAG TPA: helix-turn-helix transcriptional regulator, partial [Paracoccus sp. (in: a-proteobacteria)]|nr:helix-turn-helix transcriptional regulator [Paracoccus sp. (in: a-proteobacteria)]
MVLAGADADDFEIRLGDLMRGERATMGKSLLDVQRELRIRASYIAAIENCDISAFDAPSFISGYVRSYARYLKMNPDIVFARFCDESGFKPPHGMSPVASGPKPQRRPSDPAEALANPRALFIPQPESFWSSVEPRAIGSVMVLIALVAGLGYGGWSVLQGMQEVNLAPPDHGP